MLPFRTCTRIVALYGVCVNNARCNGSHIHILTAEIPRFGDTMCSVNTWNDVDVDAIGQRALIRRRELGLDQTQVAERSGMSREYISGLETGRNRNPKLRDLIRVAKGLTKPVDWLIWGDRPEMTDDERIELDTLRRHPDLRARFLTLARTFDDMADADKKGLLEALRLFARLRGIETGE